MERKTMRNTHFNMALLSPQGRVKSLEYLENPRHARPLSSHDFLNSWLSNQVPKNEK
jgi:hypothetical protein